jgi:hypothetical protein
VVGAGAYLLVLQAGDLSAKKKITVIR